MTPWMGQTLANIKPVDGDWHEAAATYHTTLTKPPGSLGRLEVVGCRLCAIQGRMPPLVDRLLVVVFAADHGVVPTRGVAAYPQEVTGQMVANFARDGAAINAIARNVGADLCVVDVGVAHPVAGLTESTRYRSRPVARGTRDMTVGPAMRAEELDAALLVGLEVAQECAARGVHAVALGEMGIGNTTAASAVTAALLGCSAAQVTGRGTGASDATLKKKMNVVERALAVNRPDSTDALDVLQKVGGLELAALCGLALGLARHRIAIVSDGFIATAAVTAAARVHAGVLDYLFCGHRSPEPGHTALMDELGIEPLLELEMRLGEGTGAALSLSILRAAAAVLRDMATFERAGVTDRED